MNYFSNWKKLQIRCFFWPFLFLSLHSPCSPSSSPLLSVLSLFVYMTPPLLLASYREYPCLRPLTVGSGAGGRKWGPAHCWKYLNWHKQPFEKAAWWYQSRIMKCLCPLTEYFHSRKLFKVWGKPYAWRFFNAFLFILAETEEKLLKYPKIAKSLSKLWSVHMIEKYANVGAHTQRNQISNNRRLVT